MIDALVADRSGQVIGGRYRLERPIDKGGQGDVYLAVDLQDGDQVAIKILKDKFADDPDWRERMFREARAMAQLSGTAAVRVYDQRWMADGGLCLVMELLEGQDFERFLQTHEQQGQRLTAAGVITLLDPIALTLQAAHDIGIVHRDLKPANIYITNSGGVRLLDFGFAKFTRLRGFTAAGTVPGSPSYVAPETWRGQTADQRVDVYAFGAVVFRALTARTPFVGADLRELLMAVTTAPRPSLQALRPDLPADIDAWTAQALAIDPAHRFLSVRALWNAFKNVVNR